MADPLSEERLAEIRGRATRGPRLAPSSHRDRRDLLAEVDRLRAENATLEGLLEDRCRDLGTLAPDALPGARARERVAELEEAVKRMVEAAYRSTENGGRPGLIAALEDVVRRGREALGLKN